MTENDTTQQSLRAVYMRGGTSKGLFIDSRDLPREALDDPAIRDRLLLRLMGSPDPYGKQIDGLGGATPSTSKVVLVSPSTRDDCDVSYLFGAVSVDQALIDWSNNCGNLTTAVAPFALFAGLLPAIPDGIATIRLWQANIGQRIIARLPVKNGQPIETGTFELDGVAFPSAEVRLEFLESDTDNVFPTGMVRQLLNVPGWGGFDVTLIKTGSPTAFVDARALDLVGTELQPAFEGRTKLITLIEAIRAHAAVAMGIAATPAEATGRHPHTPRLAMIAPSQDYVSSAGRVISASEIDLLVRIMSLGKLHHAMTGTGAVALAVAAAVPDTIVARVLANGATPLVRFGHPSGTLTVGAQVSQAGHEWCADRVVMSRSARRLMAGSVYFPVATLPRT
jgi:probable AcnD-accessory protein PrpF